MGRDKAALTHRVRAGYMLRRIRGADAANNSDYFSDIGGLRKYASSLHLLQRGAGGRLFCLLFAVAAPQSHHLAVQHHGDGEHLGMVRAAFGYQLIAQLLIGFALHQLLSSVLQSRRRLSTTCSGSFSSRMR